MAEIILSIDQGTTGTTVLLVDPASNVVSRGYQEVRQIYPKPGWVDHDPEDIWNSTLGAIRKAIQDGGVSTSDIRAIGITNQRETTVAWSRETGKPYRNAIVWQCRRTAPFVKKLVEEGREPLFTEKTGLVLDPYFSGTKFRWLFDNVSGLREEAGAGRAMGGTVDSWLIYKLTGGARHVTDATNASRTLLMNLATQSWDPELCEVLGVPESLLPEILPCDALFGKTRGVPGLPDGIPIHGVAGDQHAALFGQACFTPGEAKCTYGTGAFLLMNTGEAPTPSKNRLLTTMAWKTGDRAVFALEGSAFIAGALVQWLRDGLKIIEHAPEIEALAASVPDSGGVTLVPALAGLSAPYWRPEARGLISGITRGTTRAHLARAALEGIAFQNVEILKAMEADSGRKILNLKVDGGASSNNLLMQIQADCLGCRIIRPRQVETTGMGAAYMAGLGAGLFKDTGDIVSAWQEDRSFDPKTDEAMRNELLLGWREAVEKA